MLRKIQNAKIFHVVSAELNCISAQIYKFDSNMKIRCKSNLYAI